MLVFINEENISELLVRKINSSSYNIYHLLKVKDPQFVDINSMLVENETDQTLTAYLALISLNKIYFIKFFVELLKTQIERIKSLKILKKF